MYGSLKFDGVIILLVTFVAAVFLGYQTLMASWGLTPEGFKILTPVAPAEGLEPERLPQRPVIRYRGPSGSAFAFGYIVRGIPFSYTMQLNMRPNSDAGLATVTVRHAAGIAKVGAEFVRGWDQGRNAYAIVVIDRFDTEDAVPSLCIKAFIGKRSESPDSRNDSVCVAERDIPGDCRKETLACGLIR